MPTATGGALGYATYFSGTNEAALADDAFSQSGDSAVAAFVTIDAVDAAYRFAWMLGDTWNTDVALVAYRYEDDITFYAAMSGGVSTCTISAKLSTGETVFAAATIDVSSGDLVGYLKDSSGAFT